MLVLVLVVVLQFEGTRGQELNLYHREGENVVLPCNSPSSSSCSNIYWFYNRETSSSHSLEVKNGKVVDRSPRASRLNMDSSCSLTINTIDRHDAGLYSCRSGFDASHDFVCLNVLTISPSPTDAVPAKDGDITLGCSLLRCSRSDPCPDKSLLWLNETGSELTGEGDGYKSGGQFGCVSRLTVNLQSSRRFTCRFVEGNEVKIEAQYQHEAAPASNSTTIIIIGSVICVLLLLVVLAAIFTKLRKTRNGEDHISTDQDSTCGNHHYDELQPNLTYATVDLPETSQTVKLGKGTVTYSTVRTKEKTEAN